MAKMIETPPCRYEVVVNHFKSLLPKFGNELKVSWSKTSDGAHLFLESSNDVPMDVVYGVVKAVRKNGVLENLDATSIPDCCENRFGISLTPFGML